jgi:hypothetical protein
MSKENPPKPEKVDGMVAFSVSPVAALEYTLVVERRGVAAALVVKMAAARVVMLVVIIGEVGVLVVIMGEA